MIYFPNMYNPDMHDRPYYVCWEHRVLLRREKKDSNIYKNGAPSLKYLKK